MTAPYEIQDLADIVGELADITAGVDLNFHIRLELGGANQVQEDVVKKVNGILADSIDKLIFIQHS